jgi:hypothetical protein
LRLLRTFVSMAASATDCEERQMNTSTTTASSPSAYRLRFRSLFNEGRGYVFPCDAQGHVDLDTLSRQALNSYLYARTVIGREFSMPAVECAMH